MSLITKADLSTHLYDSNLNAIIRGNESIVDKAIAAAEAEAKSYLSRYDTDAIFVTSFTDENLKNKVKDLAAWYLVRLANPNIDLELFRTNYEDAIAWFKLIQKGQAAPYGWPVRTDDPNTSYVEGGAIQWTSNKKRLNQL